MVKKILLLLLLSSAAVQLRAQVTNAVIGKLLNSENQPIAGATILIKEGNKQTLSRNDGTFSFQNITPGIYVIKVSCVGCHSIEKKIQVTAGSIVTVDFNLSKNAAELNEININANKNSNNRPVTLSKAAISPLDLPQSTGVVTSKIIDDQQVNRIGDAIRNVAGVSLTQTRGGVSESFSARGYTIGIAGAAGSIFRNGVLTNTAGFPDASTLESIEVLKGSSALLYGNTSGGLIINLVTKKPRFDFGGEVSMRYGSYNLYKPIVDVYGPISKNIAFRIVGSYENSDSYRNQVKNRITSFSPSLNFNLGKKTTLLVEGTYLKSDLTPDNGIGSINNGRFLPDVSRSQYSNTFWAYSHLEQETGSATLNHHFNSNWNLSAIASVQRTSVNSFGSSLPNNVAVNGDWNRGLARAKTFEGDYTGQINLNGRFKTGFATHQLLVGTDAVQVLNKTNTFAINGLTTENIYDKINIIDLNKYQQRTDMPNATATLLTKSPSFRYGYYAQDLISLTEKFKVLAGLRYSIVKTEQTYISDLVSDAASRGTAATKFDRAFSPKFALLYQPVKTTSLYATYSNNFTSNSAYIDIYGATLQPSTVNQYEAGLKNDLFNGRVTANLSVYRIVNSNLAVQAQFDRNGVTNTLASVREFSGQTTSDGFDIDVNANLSKNFYVIAGYSHNYMRYTATGTGKGSYILGERLVNNPANTYNASTFYTFNLPALRRLKVGASAFYTGSRFGGYNNTVGQTQNYSRLIPLKGFTTVDLSAGYAFQKFSLLGKVSNIGNTLNYLIHDNYSITPIPPRQFLATLSYKF